MLHSYLKASYEPRKSINLVDTTLRLCKRVWVITLELEHFRLHMFLLLTIQDTFETLKRFSTLVL